MNTEPEIDKEEEPSPVDEEELENETDAGNEDVEPAADDGAEEAGGQEGSDDESADGEEISAAEADDDDDSLGATCTIEDAGPCKKVVKATVPVEKVKKILAHNYEELSSTVRLPGFRRGRVPWSKGWQEWI